MENINESYILNEENIDTLPKKIYEYLKELKYPEDDSVSSRLSVETVLVEWFKHGAVGKSFSVEIKQSFGRLHIYLKLEAPRIDFYASKEDTEFLDALEKSISVSVSIKYTNGVNIIDIKLPRKELSNFGQIIVAFVSACLLGELLPSFFPPDALQSLSQDYLTPSYSAIIGALGAVAVFQIFFAVLDSIIGMEHITVFQDLGAKYIKTVAVTTAATTCIGGIIMLMFYPILREGITAYSEELKEIFLLLVEIIPTNMLQPFLDGHMLQVVLIACFFGSLLLLLKNEISRLNKIIRDLNNLFQFAIMTLSKLMPLFVFLSLLSLFLTGQFHLILNSWQLLLLHAICCLAVALTMLVAASAYSRINLFRLLVNCLPVLLTGFTTASTVMTIPAIRKVLKDHNISENISKLNISLGYVFSRHTCCMVTMVIITYCYSALGEPIELGEFIMLGVISMVLAVAAPSVPGGGAAIIASLMAHYGIPLKMVAIVLSLDYFMDMITTGTGCLCITAEGIILNKLSKRS